MKMQLLNIPALALHSP